MIERFDGQEIYSELNKLEEGIFVEKIQRSIDDEMPPEDYFYGNKPEDIDGWVFDANPDKNLNLVAHMLINQMYEETETSSVDLAHVSEIDVQDMTVGEFARTLKDRELYIEEHLGLNLKEIISLLDDNGKLLCFLNADIIEGTPAAKLKGLTANRVVELVGVDISNPCDIRAFYNDTTCADGCGKSCGWTVFSSAWATSGKYAMFVFRG